MERSISAMVAGVVLLAAASGASAQTLRGSAQTMQRQHRVAQQHDYTFLRTSADVRTFVSESYLVPIRGNGDYQLAGVSHPYGRPAVKVFIERLASQYRSSCGERLVVTSLTRPIREQPRNASDLSVHPAGMAVDLRLSQRSSCRKWLEKTLLSLEKQGVLDATRENRPPHYHVALFPNTYTRYVARLTGSTESRVLASAAPARTPAAGTRAVTPATTTRTVATRSSADAVATRNGDGPGAAVVATVSANQRAGRPPMGDAVDVQSYRVRGGDSLWSIARRHGTTVDTIVSLNGLRGTMLVAGQVIQLPVSADAESN
jgi:LysM repeat protein